MKKRRKKEKRVLPDEDVAVSAGSPARREGLRGAGLGVPAGFPSPSRGGAVRWSVGPGIGLGLAVPRSVPKRVPPAVTAGSVAAPRTEAALRGGQRSRRFGGGSRATWRRRVAAGGSAGLRV